MTDTITLEDRNEFVRHRFEEFVDASRHPEVAEGIYRAYLQIAELYDRGMAGLQDDLDEADRRERMHQRLQRLEGHLEELQQTLPNPAKAQTPELSETRKFLGQAHTLVGKLDETLSKIDDLQENGKILVGLRTSMSGYNVAMGLVGLRENLSSALRHCALTLDEVPRDPAKEFAARSQEAVEQGEAEVDVEGIMRGGR